MIRPFAGLLPAPGNAAQVAAPPYDVLDSREARVRASGNPLSFLHVSKAEIDLPPGTDPHAPEVYAKARENFDALIARGVLCRAARPAYYVYRLTRDGHRQTGLVAAASVQAYDSGRIRRHELTRPDKEDDRVHHMQALDAQTGPVLVAYRAQAAIDERLRAITRTPPAIDLVADTGVRHELWTVADPAWCDAMTAAFEALPALYIADGHHRSAAASRVAAARRGRARGDSHEYFLVVAFAHDALRILDYNRVVADLNGLTEAQFLARLCDAFDVEPAAAPVAPTRRGEFGLCLRSGWLRLRVHADRVPADAVASLDVSVLADQVLAPLLGITDVRRDPRIDFVGGIRGLDALRQRVADGAAAAFSLHATSMEDLMRVADAGQIMPPKSTWFEPKLADGLVCHMLD